MTNDLDAILSAYIDGQATPDEVALVEADPELLAQAERLRATAASLADTPPPPAAVRADQLAAALRAFDERATGNASSTVGLAAATGSDTADDVTDTAGLTTDTNGDVTDLADRRRRGTRASRSGGGSSRRSGSAATLGRASGVPSWLGAAAALLLVVGGLGWVISQSRGGDDAALEVTDAASDQETTMAATESAVAESDDAGASDSAQAEGSETDETSADSAAATADDGADESARTTAKGFFDDQTVEEARVSFEAIPNEQELAALTAGQLLSPELSRCITSPELALDLEPTGFVPIAVDGLLGEVLIYLDAGNGTSVVRVVDEGCDPLS